MLRVCFSRRGLGYGMLRVVRISGPIRHKHSDAPLCAFILLAIGLQNSMTGFSVGIPQMLGPAAH